MISFPNFKIGLFVVLCVDLIESSYLFDASQILTPLLPTR